MCRFMDSQEKEFEDYIAKLLNRDYLSEYKRKAENGDVLAQRILGDIYFYGITADEKYFENIDCAVLYAKRMGNYALLSECNEEPNYIEALKWYEMAAKNGDAHAKKQIGKFRSNEPVNRAKQALQFFNYKEMR